MDTIARIHRTKVLLSAACLGLSMFFTGNASAQSSAVLAGWYDFTTCTGPGGDGGNPCEQSANSKTADVSESGITATLYGGDGTRTNTSEDGTFGPTISTGPGDSAGNGGANNYSIVHRSASPDINLFFTVTNNTGTDVVFETLDFDAAVYSNTGAQGLSLEHWSGDLDNEQEDGAQYPAALSGAPDGSSNGDWRDFSYDFTGFDDVTLADGESTVFILSLFSGDGNTPPHGPALIDNIALVGRIVVEPTAVPALGGLGLGLLALLAGLLGVVGIGRKRH